MLNFPRPIWPQYSLWPQARSKAYFWQASCPVFIASWLCHQSNHGGRAIKFRVLSVGGLALFVWHVGRSGQFTWRKRLGAPTSPTHPKELPALRVTFGFVFIFAGLVAVAVSQAKLKCGAGGLVVWQGMALCTIRIQIINLTRIDMYRAFLISSK
ncbi:hypothetical protein [Photobacterium nomapromontoriensis]|uniref:hypothetical protein n=1 Tax=Photobacterium nomapromontoriensis TaxID=2910237 RepID=UPI003D14908B